jgi:hypothetical protein
MKSLLAIASSLLLCSCADMVVTKTYVPNSAAGAGPVDAKDFGSGESVRYSTNCGVGEAKPSAIYIRPFCIDTAAFRSDEAASDGEMPIRKALTPIAFAQDLKEELSKMAPTRILKDDEAPKVGWMVEGRFDNVNSSVSSLSMHVKVTDVEKHRVIYEFDMAGGNNGQGVFGTIRGSGGRFATAFDLRNAAERILLVLSPDAFRFGARTSVVLQ